MNNDIAEGTWKQIVGKAAAPRLLQQDMPVPSARRSAGFRFT
ncbi:hypothetical protein [Paraburkholderia sp.]